MFCTCLEKFLPFSSNLRLSSAESTSFDESKICRLGKGLTFTKPSRVFGTLDKTFGSIVGKGEKADNQSVSKLLHLKKHSTMVVIGP